MFEIGKKCEIRMIMGGEKTTILVKFADVHADTVEPFEV
jgi:hypothetical protein